MSGGPPPKIREDRDNLGQPRLLLENGIESEMALCKIVRLAQHAVRAVHAIIEAPHYGCPFPLLSGQ